MKIGNLGGQLEEDSYFHFFSWHFSSISKISTHILNQFNLVLQRASEIKQETDSKYCPSYCHHLRNWNQYFPWRVPLCQESNSHSLLISSFSKHFKEVRVAWLNHRHCLNLCNLLQLENFNIVFEGSITLMVLNLRGKWLHLLHHRNYQISVQIIFSLTHQQFQYHFSFWYEEGEPFPKFPHCCPNYHQLFHEQFACQSPQQPYTP